MHQHTQQAEASKTRPMNEEYENSSTSSATEAEKEIIAENALNEGATQPYKEPVAEEHQRTDGGDIEKQTTTRSIRSGKAVSVNNVAAIPNGGTKAWLQVLGAWVLFFNSWGISTFRCLPFYVQASSGLTN